jgi:hypothetical protein
MESSKLTLNCTDPVISFKGLLVFTKGRRLSFKEISKCSTSIGTTLCVLGHTLKEMFSPHAIVLDVLENLRHCGRWRQFIITMVTTTTALATSTT